MRGTYVVGSHHLASTLAEKGHEVVHLSSPISPFHVVRWWSDTRVRERLKSWYKGIITTASGVYEGVPLSVIPGKLNLRFIPSTNLMLRFMLPSIREILRQIGIEELDAVFIDQPSYFNIRRHVSVDKVVYRPTDIYSKIHDLPSLGQVERSILARADGLVATSQPVLEHLSVRMPSTLPTRVISNGVEYDHFRKPAEPPSEYDRIESPRAVYIGAIDERFDWDLIVETAVKRPDIQFVIIGRTSPRTVVGKSPDNVHVLGERPYRTLPGYLQHGCVGLLPTNQHQANEGRSPMKIYEYMASGLEVIAHRTAELERRSSPLMNLYDTPDEFAAQIDKCIQRSGTRASKCRERAREESWETKVDELIGFLEAL
jgi:glycosyltransferase involved in cell wall biosynthesis